MQAYKRNLTYPGYTWIVFDWYPQEWWTEEVANNKVNCTDDQLEGFLERVLSLREDPALDLEAGPTDTGIVSFGACTITSSSPEIAMKCTCR